MRRVLALCLALLVPVPQAVLAQGGLEVNVDGGYEPSEAENTHVLDLSARLMEAEDAGDAETVHAAFAPATKAAIPLDQLRGIMAQIRPYPEPRQPVGLTYYVNNPDVPEDTVFIAVDWLALDGDAIIGTGYLVWQKDPDGTYSLLRSENDDLRIREDVPAESEDQ